MPSPDHVNADPSRRINWGERAGGAALMTVSATSAWYAVVAYQGRPCSPLALMFAVAASCAGAPVVFGVSMLLPQRIWNRSVITIAILVIALAWIVIPAAIFFGGPTTSEHNCAV